MSNTHSPTKLRKAGREAFIPGEDPNKWNPYLKTPGSWAARMYAPQWNEGWLEAQAYHDAYEEPEPSLEERLEARIERLERFNEGNKAWAQFVKDNPV